MGADDKTGDKAAPPEPVAPSPSTSGPEVDTAADPGRVGPVKLQATAPKPLTDSGPPRVGPEKIRVARPDETS